MIISFEKLLKARLAIWLYTTLAGCSCGCYIGRSNSYRSYHFERNYMLNKRFQRLLNLSVQDIFYSI